MKFTITQPLEISNKYSTMGLKIENVGEILYDTTVYGTLYRLPTGMNGGCIAYTIDNNNNGNQI